MKYSEVKRVLVTGGAGFIGSALVHELARQRVFVVVVDNLVNGHIENLEGLSHDQIELVIADIRDIKLITELLSGIDIVFHLACLGVRQSIHSPQENHEVNAGATLKLLSASRKAELKRFVYVSSSEVYGTARVVPMNEDHPTFPMTVYGASKLAGECYARAFYQTHGFPTVMVRPFNTFGPRCHHEGDSGEVIPRFMLRCLAGLPMVIFGDGFQSRDFTYVTDTARGIMMAGFLDSAVGQTINLGSGSSISINELAREVRDVVVRPDVEVTHDDPRPGDVQNLCADISKAKKLLGFEPTVKLREGLEMLIDWYKSLGCSPKSLLEQEVLHNWENIDKY